MSESWLGWATGMTAMSVESFQGKWSNGPHSRRQSADLTPRASG